MVDRYSVLGVAARRSRSGASSSTTRTCLATVADQFKIRLSAMHPAYDQLLELFRADLENQSEFGLSRRRGP